MTDTERIDWLSQFDVWVTDGNGNIILYDPDGGPLTPERLREEMDSSMADVPKPYFKEKK